MNILNDVPEEQLEKLWVNNIKFKPINIKPNRADIIVTDCDYDAVMHMIGGAYGRDNSS